MAQSPRSEAAAAAQADLLRKAVVALERKLQERGAQLAEAGAERDGLRRDAERWAADRQELQQAAAEAAELRREAGERGAELARARAEAEGLRAERDRLQVGPSLFAGGATVCRRSCVQGFAQAPAKRAAARLSRAAGGGCTAGGRQRPPRRPAGAVEERPRGGRGGRFAGSDAATPGPSPSLLPVL